MYTYIYIYTRPLRARYEESFLDILSKVIDKMVHNVDTERVIKDVHKKMAAAGKWRTLQIAFSKQLAGTLKNVDFFQSFFNDFKLPSNLELEKAIESLRKYAAELVQMFLKSEIFDALQSSERTGTRAQTVDDTLKILVDKTVESIVPVSEVSAASHTLDEALSLLTRGFAKTKNKSVKALLTDSQVESLRKNLLTDNDTGHANCKDRRKKEGKYLENLYRKIVSDKAATVIAGAKDLFSGKIRAEVELMLKDVNSRLIERRGKSKRLPVIIKLRRAIFKHLHELDYRQTDLSHGVETRKFHLQLEEFGGKWQTLTVDDVATETVDEAHRRFRECIYLRHLMVMLEKDGSGIPSKCAAKKMKVSKLEKLALEPADACAVIKTMHTDCSGADEKSYYALIDRLALLNLMLGHSTRDNDSLFRTLDQILRDYKEAKVDDDEQGSSTSVDNTTMARRLRASIVRIVLLKHDTQEKRQQFYVYTKESVQDWARRMCMDGEPGDPVCIEYFARHFRVNIRVYSSICEEPIQFPTYLDQGVLSSKPLFDTSLYRLAHVPFEPGALVSCANHYLPIWPGRIAFMQGPSPAVLYEVDTTMKSTSSVLAGERAQRKKSSQLRMQSAETPQAIEETRTRQAQNKQNARDKQAKKAGWTKLRSRGNATKEYYFHPPTRTSCSPDDFQAVVNGTHPTIKLEYQLGK